MNQPVSFNPQTVKMRFDTRNGKPHYKRHSAHDIRPGDLILVKGYDGSLHPAQVHTVEVKVPWVRISVFHRSGIRDGLTVPFINRVWVCKNVHGVR